MDSGLLYSCSHESLAPEDKAFPAQVSTQLSSFLFTFSKKQREVPALQWSSVPEERTLGVKTSAPNGKQAGASSPLSPGAGQGGGASPVQPLNLAIHK